MATKVVCVFPLRLTDSYCVFIVTVAANADGHFIAYKIALHDKDDVRGI